MFEHGLGEHCFRGGLVSQLFRSSKSGSVVARVLLANSRWLVLCRFHSLEATRTSQATPGVSVARQSLGFFPSSHQGEERARIPAAFRARIFKPLGSSGALREGLKTTSGGRLASSAGV